jgi:hypothetical protein
MKDKIWKNQLRNLRNGLFLFIWEITKHAKLLVLLQIEISRNSEFVSKLKKRYSETAKLILFCDSRNTKPWSLETLVIAAITALSLLPRPLLPSSMNTLFWNSISNFVTQSNPLYRIAPGFLFFIFYWEFLPCSNEWATPPVNYG